MNTDSTEHARLQELYREHDCANRDEYLKQLAEDNGVDLEIVLTLASTLGPNEDFDGLVVAVEDIGDGFA